MRTQRQALDFYDLIDCGDWSAAAAELVHLHESEVALRLETLDAACRAEIFGRLHASRWLKVYAAISAAKQNRELALIIGGLR